MREEGDRKMARTKERGKIVKEKKTDKQTERQK